MFCSPFIDKKDDDAKETFMIKKVARAIFIVSQRVVTTIMPKLNDSFSFTTTRAEYLWSLRPRKCETIFILGKMPNQ